MAMERHDALPVTIFDIMERLDKGQQFKIKWTDVDGEEFHFSLALSTDKQRVLFKQDNAIFQFNQLDTAIIALLNCIGEYTAQ
jgi:hypothetical protein